MNVVQSARGEIDQRNYVEAQYATSMCPCSIDWEAPSVELPTPGVEACTEYGTINVLFNLRVNIGIVEFRIF